MASSSNSSTIGNIQNLMPIFDGENYEYWSLQMKTLSISQDLWDLVEDGYEELEKTSTGKATPESQQALKENRKRDAKALFLIQKGISKNLFPRLLSASKNAWEILKIEFQGSQKVFFTKVSGIVNQIRSYGDTIIDKKIVEKTLRSLPPKFDHVVAAIEESKDLGALSLHELIGSLEAHEKRINRSTDHSLEQAFQSKLDSKEKEDKQKGESQKSQNRKSKGESHWRKNHNKGNYNNNNQQGRSHQNNQNGNLVPECRVCKKTRHKSADCWYRCTRCRIPNHSPRDCRYQKNNEANFTKNNDSPEQLFYTCLNARQEPQDIWYVDSGCSNHMTGNRQCFVKFEENVNSQVKLGDGKLHNVKGKGIISVQTREGTPKLIYDVLYVPNLAQKLLSVGQLLQKVFSVKFDDDHCVISDKKNNIVVAKIKMMANKVFPLIMTSKENYVLKAENVEESLLWHMRYGHLNQRSLQLLH
ncbi:unnamed protein product [Prunus brigantina]